MGRAKIINVNIEKGEAGLFHATSPQLKELIVSARSIEEMNSAVPTVIEAIFDAHGESVRVYEAEDGHSAPAPWVIVPKGEASLNC